MAARKPDSEVGALGVWAYDTARYLGLSAAQVAARVEVSEPTIRKIEGGSTRQPSVRLIRAMHNYFQERARETGKVAPPPPNGWLEQRPAPIVGASELAAALSDLAEELRQVRLERAAWQRGVLAVIRSYRAGQVPAELLDALAPQPLEDALP